MTPGQPFTTSSISDDVFDIPFDEPSDKAPEGRRGNIDQDSSATPEVPLYHVSPFGETDVHRGDADHDPSAIPASSPSINAFGEIDVGRGDADQDPSAAPRVPLYHFSPSGETDVHRGDADHDPSAIPASSPSINAFGEIDVARGDANQDPSATSASSPSIKM
ncbi:hypothetical protein K440DRAFT_638996 [Wilcoxina mikolae CBS 423.85]|nr:hypothetical protein K440DRAFT_638996 [Wilcoxina mikolae CBS 423.85]